MTDGQDSGEVIPVCQPAIADYTHMHLLLYKIATIVSQRYTT